MAGALSRVTIIGWGEESAEEGASPACFHGVEGGKALTLKKNGTQV